MNYVTAITTAPQDKSAEIAESMVKDRNAACANIVPGVTSYYWWKGKLEKDSEDMIFFQTRGDLKEDFIKKLKSVHPYEVPKIIFYDIKGGNPDYLNWIGKETGK
jgi:periplasmic divalent cation tolerance protein